MPASLEELYIQQLKTLQDAETKLIGNLEEMLAAAADPNLQATFEEHLARTREHAERLKELLRRMGELPEGECEAIKCLIAEAQEAMRAESPAEVRDVAMIGAAQRMEHYEIASYGCLRTYASILGREEESDILQTILDEEWDADGLLTETAEQLEAGAGAHVVTAGHR